MDKGFKKRVHLSGGRWVDVGYRITDNGDGTQHTEVGDYGASEGVTEEEIWEETAKLAEELKAAHTAAGDVIYDERAMGQPVVKA